MFLLMKMYYILASRTWVEGWGHFLEIFLKFKRVEEMWHNKDSREILET